ncbi:DDE-type integrase/transposase/recombinase [Bacillus nitratireducens]|uniref:DDE-type integrase/transposase/recombinase n=1 Tax=Bacillus nitratireducens TaxID=2026193 RepID=UPI0011A3F6C5|nr:DDE-type integrase/transposase/recombinase [Bacillus nitratireducens]
MKEKGMRSKTTKKYKATANSKHSLPNYPNLLNQQFDVGAPGKFWVTDIIYMDKRRLVVFSDGNGFIFAPHYMSKRMDKRLVLEAFERAIRVQPPKEGLIHHSDRGSQYGIKRISSKITKQRNRYKYE